VYTENVVRIDLEEESLTVSKATSPPSQLPPRRAGHHVRRALARVCPMGQSAPWVK